MYELSGGNSGLSNDTQAIDFVGQWDLIEFGKLRGNEDRVENKDPFRYLKILHLS